MDNTFLIQLFKIKKFAFTSVGKIWEKRWECSDSPLPLSAEFPPAIDPSPKPISFNMYSDVGLFQTQNPFHSEVAATRNTLLPLDFFELIIGKRSFIFPSVFVKLSVYVRGCPKRWSDGF